MLALFTRCCAVLMLIGGLLLAPSAWAQIPQLLAYHGRLTQNNGVPLTGEHTLVFRIYDVESGGAELWKEPHPIALTVTDNGLFSTVLGSLQPLDIQFNQPLWLSIEVDGEGEMTPRQRLAAVGYAITADTLDGLDSAQFARLDTAATLSKQLTLTYAGVALLVKPAVAPATNAKVMEVQSLSGAPRFSIDAEGDVAVAGDLTVTGAIQGANTTAGTLVSVGSGPGLTGGPITTSGTLSVNVASGAGLSADTSGLSILRTCADGQLLKWNASSTSWACAADTDTDTNAGGTVTSVDSGGGLTGGPVTASGTLAVGAGNGIAVGADAVAVNVAAGAGLAADSSGVSLLRTCADGQLLKWNAGSASWACAADTDTDTDTNSGGDLTSVAAGTGLVGGGETGDVTLNIGSGTGMIVGADAISVNVGTGANQIVQLDSAAKLPALDGGALTALNAAALASGTVADARLSSEVSLLGSAVESAEITDGTIVADDTATAFLSAGSGVSVSKGASSWTISATGSGGTVTSVDSGDGLTGGPVTGAGTLAVNPASGGGLSAAAGGVSLLRTCADGQLLKWNSGSSAWACAADTDTDTNAGGDVTGVTAGAGLTGGGTSGDVTLSLDTPVTVALGGTGAVTAAAARTSLGAAASGANSDLTSLSGLTTPLSVAQGGTGAATLASGGVLLGQGASAVATTGALAKGSLIVGDGTADPEIVSIGGDNTMLMADSTKTSGVRWASGCIPVGGASSSSHNADFEMGVGGGSDTNGRLDHVWPAPISGTLTQMAAYVGAAPGTGDSWVVTVRKNDANTALTCTVSGAGSQSCSATGAITVAAGDRIGVIFDEVGSAAGTTGSGWSACLISD